MICKCDLCGTVHDNLTERCANQVITKWDIYLHALAYMETRALPSDIELPKKYIRRLKKYVFLYRKRYRELRNKNFPRGGVTDGAHIAHRELLELIEKETNPLVALEG